MFHLILQLRRVKRSEYGKKIKKTMNVKTAATDMIQAKRQRFIHTSIIVFCQEKENKLATAATYREPSN